MVIRAIFAFMSYNNYCIVIIFKIKNNNNKQQYWSDISVFVKKKTSLRIHNTCTVSAW